MIESIIKEVSESILIESCEDYEGLWVIPWTLREIHNETDSLVIRQVTLRIVRELLENGLVLAGSFIEREFQIWNISNSDILERISAEWDALRNDPNIGEIVWFIASKKGQQTVRLITEKQIN